ncbi:hypothetical protein J2R80_008306 [Bradyrhizobium sp. USDA 4541]|nr:hypothetical protein [Bradyrhizobium sp. USDA 4541]
MDDYNRLIRCELWKMRWLGALMITDRGTRPDASFSTSGPEYDLEFGKQAFAESLHVVWFHRLIFREYARVRLVRLVPRGANTPVLAPLRH